MSIIVAQYTPITLQVAYDTSSSIETSYSNTIYSGFSHSKPYTEGATTALVVLKNFTVNNDGNLIYKANVRRHIVGLMMPVSPSYYDASIFGGNFTHVQLNANARMISDPAKFVPYSGTGQMVSRKIAWADLGEGLIDSSVTTIDNFMQKFFNYNLISQ